MKHTTDEARFQPDAALAACQLDNGAPCSTCIAETRTRRSETDRRRPGLFDLRRQLGRAPTVEEYRETRQ